MIQKLILNLLCGHLYFSCRMLIESVRFLQAYITICDLLVVFCNQLFTNPNPLLGDLVYEADKSLQTMLNVFIQNNVFVYQEEGRCKNYFCYLQVVIFFLGKSTWHRTTSRKRDGQIANYTKNRVLGSCEPTKSCNSINSI